MLGETVLRRPTILLTAVAAALLLDLAAAACIEPGLCPDPSLDTGIAESRPGAPETDWSQVSIGVPVVDRDAQPGFSPRGDDHVKGAIRAEASVEHVWAVLSGLESWPGLFADVESARLERTPDGALVLHQVVHAMGQSMHYSSIAEIEAEQCRVSLVMSTDRPSDFDDMVGRWRLEQLPDGSTLIELRVRGKSGYRVPGFVERRMVAHGVRRSLVAVARAAEARRDAPLSAGLPSE